MLGGSITAGFTVTIPRNVSKRSIGGLDTEPADLRKSSDAPLTAPLKPLATRQTLRAMFNVTRPSLLASSKGPHPKSKHCLRKLRR